MKIVTLLYFIFIFLIYYSYLYTVIYLSQLSFVNNISIKSTHSPNLNLCVMKQKFLISTQTHCKSIVKYKILSKELLLTVLSLLNKNLSMM